MNIYRKVTNIAGSCEHGQDTFQCQSYDWYQTNKSNYYWTENFSDDDGVTLSLSSDLKPLAKQDELLSFEIVPYFTKHHCEEAQFTNRTNKTRNKREMICGTNFHLKNKTLIKKKEIKIDKLGIWL